MVFPAAEAAVTAAVERIAGEAGLRIEPGKLVLELRPPTNVDEGIALARLMADHELRTIVYVGDDRGDIPAMRLTISAGRHALLVDDGVETPSLLRDLATEIFDGVESFQAWLSALARRLEEAHSPSRARKNASPIRSIVARSCQLIESAHGDNEFTADVVVGC